MIKLFEQFNNEQIIKDFAEKYIIGKYSINEDGSVDVTGDVKVINTSPQSKLINIPIRFNKISGDFRINGNYITSLEGCPKWVGGEFNCSANELTSLLHSPDYVGGNFSCSYNDITSLKDCPKEIGGSFFCTSNDLSTLEGIPNIIYGELRCNINNIRTLKGFPSIIKGDLEVTYNGIRKVDSSISVGGTIHIENTAFIDMIIELPQEKLKVLFEHGVDYDIFRSDGTTNFNRLERLFKDFEL